MADTTFRAAPEPVAEQPTDTTAPEPNLRGADEGAALDGVVESPMTATASALGVRDLSHLPENTQQALGDISGYLEAQIEARGLPPTQDSYARALADAKADMGLDPDAALEVVIDRVAGVITAWKNLSFVRDAAEKRRIMMKLARATDSREMNRIVFDEMERSSVWR